ncbi:MAG: IS1380 family transposase [Acidimicrobiia bacterium]
MRSSHSLDRVDVVFDDDHQVANAGLILPATLAQHLGIKELADETIKLGPVPGAALPGRKVMTVVHGILAGADSIDDLDVLRAGATQKVLGHVVMAPSTIGTFLRAFTFGHVRQLDRLTELVLARAWAAGAGPGDAPMTIDIDSTINGVHGKQKQGASYGYTKQLGYHPLLATRAETGEVLHVRLRGGRTNTGRGAPRFIDELVGRVRRAGATGQLTLRADSGFWSKKVIKACRKHGVRYSITVRNTKPIKKAIAGIADDVWVRIPYPESGIAEVAEVAHDGARLIVRRVRNLDDQGQLFPDWRYHAFITDREGPTLELEADHRNHAVIELAIRDLKEGAGWNHCPSGRFHANAAWLVIASLAHNLLRWIGRIALAAPGPVVAKTLRFRYLSLPGRMTRSARRETLHLPENWPWRTQFSAALDRLRAGPAAA